MDSSGKSAYKDYKVVKIETRENRFCERFQSNIATVVLEKSIDLLQENGPNAACLPACGGMFEYEYSNGTGVRCWMSSWDEMSGQFIKIDLPIYKKSRCNYRYDRGAFINHVVSLGLKSRKKQD